MRYVGGLKVLTPAEAARMLGVPRLRVYDLIRRGKVRAVYHGYRLYVPVLEVERYARQEVEPTAERVAAKLLGAAGVKARLIFSWKNGHGQE